jgi:hypothetical protein
MNKLRIIKKTSALLLALSFFLPLSIFKCGAKVAVKIEPAIVGTDGETIEKKLSEHTIKSKDKPMYVDNYNIPYKGIDPLEPASWILLLTFIWPIPILILNFYGRPAKVISVLKIIEPIACIGTGYVVICISFIFGDPLFAGYMATGAISCYFIVSCFDAGLIIRDFINNWRTKAFT